MAQECSKIGLTRVSHTVAREECQRESHKSVLEERHAKLSHSVLQDCRAIVSIPFIFRRIVY